MAENDGAMTNEDLSAAYRTESNSTQLTALRKDFYVAAQQLIDSLSKECFRLMSESPDSVMYEGMVQKKKKAQENFKNVVRIRMDKISGMAVRGARGSSNVIDHLTSEEKEYYNKVLEASKEFWRIHEGKKRNLVTQDITEVERPKEPVVVEDVPLSEIPVDDVPEDMGSPAEEIIDDEEIPIPEPVPEPVEETVPEEIPEEVPEEEPQKDVGEEGDVVIRILEDLPPFSGPEVDYYLKKEDIVRMPAILARILINQGKARLVPTA